MHATDVASQLGGRFKLHKAPSAVSYAGRRRALSFVELKSDSHLPFQTAPRVQEDAYIVGVIMQDFPQYKYWEDGRPAPIRDLLEGQVTFNDMRLDGRAIMDRPFHTVYCHIPRAALDQIYEDRGTGLSHLRYEPGLGMTDVIIRNLVLSARGALVQGQASNKLYLDHVGLALVSHLAMNYADRNAVTFAKGGLAPWQQRRVEDMMDASLVSPPGLSELAAACGLSVRHFTRAFVSTVGKSPHEWLRYRRIEVAKTFLLAQPYQNVAEIALRCGFADPGHFSRVFAFVVGTTPSAWRREMVGQR
jgi:AraC-like DNA-binding protein